LRVAWSTLEAIETYVSKLRNVKQTLQSECKLVSSLYEKHPAPARKCGFGRAEVNKPNRFRTN